MNRREVLSSAVGALPLLVASTEGVFANDAIRSATKINPNAGVLAQSNVPAGDWLDNAVARLAQRARMSIAYSSLTCFNGNCPPDPKEDGFKVHLWTKKHHYVITAKSNYLGCVASVRQPLPGETWTRGNDLADGKRTPETWQRIMEDIVGYELVPGRVNRTPHTPITTF
jgi:hypothetical protein